MNHPFTLHAVARLHLGSHLVLNNQVVRMDTTGHYLAHFPLKGETAATSWHKGDAYVLHDGLIHFKQETKKVF